MPVPIHTFILKVASRCNLNCSYCFVYNLADSTWRSQPALMSPRTARHTALRIREHCEAHAKRDVSIVFHGGEPLLGGVQHLRDLGGAIASAFADTDISHSLGFQSNGLLITPDIVEFLLDVNGSIGISIDGPPRVNDRYRIDHAGRPSSAKLEDALGLLLSPRYRQTFSGFLAVVNIDADPLEVYEYLASFHPPSIDFLLPYDNHDRRPLGKDSDQATPYADWLIPIFDTWYAAPRLTTIRMFDNILTLLLGGHSAVESLGLDPVDLIVVETNGDVEAVDSLKASYDGATRLGLNVFDHAFDVALNHVAVLSRQQGAGVLCAKCQTCPVVRYCGGGYLPNRYSAARGFDNPSVYCTDLEKLIRHIHASVTATLSTSRSAPQ